MESIRADQRLGKDAVIMHAGGYYATIDADEALYYVVELEGKPRKRFRKWTKEFIAQKYRITYDP